MITPQELDFEFENDNKAKCEVIIDALLKRSYDGKRAWVGKYEFEEMCKKAGAHIGYVKTFELKLAKVYEAWTVNHRPGVASQSLEPCSAEGWESLKP